MMTEEEFRSYRFSSGEEPSDEMLERLMENATEEATRTNREAYERFFDELNKQAAEIHRRKKKELEAAQNTGKTNQKITDNYYGKDKNRE